MPSPPRPDRLAAIGLAFLLVACSGETNGDGPVAQGASVAQEAGGAPAVVQVPDEPLVEEVDFSKRFWSSALTLEERIGSLERRLATGKEPYFLDMHDFGGWTFDERKEDPFPAHIRALDGTMVTIRGFMMPDIDFENISKFHLVRSLYSCCFGAPPTLNEILRVTLRDGDGMDYTYNTLEITGRLDVVFEMEDGLVEDLFRIEDATYRILDYDDPMAPEGFDADSGFDGVIPAPGAQF